MDSSGFGAVVEYSLLEPRVLQRLLGSYPGFRVVDKDSTKEIEELPIESSVRRDKFLMTVNITRSNGTMDRLT